jgi:hypothetical protein
VEIPCVCVTIGETVIRRNVRIEINDFMMTILKDGGISEKKNSSFSKASLGSKNLKRNEGKSSRPFNVLILNFRNAGLLHMMI